MKTLITKILLTFVIIIPPYKSSSQTITHELPSLLYPFSYEDNGTDQTDFFLLTPLKLYTQSGASGYKNPRPVIINGDGELVWFSGETYTNCLDFKYYPEQGIYSYTIVDQGIPHTILLDSYLAILDTISAINGIADVHDIQRADNGNWLLAMVYSDTVDLSAETFGGVQGSNATVLTGFGVQEIDASGTVIFEWNSNDYIPATETYDFYGYDPNGLTTVTAMPLKKILTEICYFHSGTSMRFTRSIALPAISSGDLGDNLPILHLSMTTVLADNTISGNYPPDITPCSTTQIWRRLRAFPVVWNISWTLLTGPPLLSIQLNMTLLFLHVQWVITKRKTMVIQPLEMVLFTDRILP
jgi:hypothetical protein